RAARDSRRIPTESSATWLGGGRAAGPNLVAAAGGRAQFDGSGVSSLWPSYAGDWTATVDRALDAKWHGVTEYSLARTTDLCGAAAGAKLLEVERLT
ncbi:Cytochrome c1, partial [Frankliniella fusca]